MARRRAELKLSREQVAARAKLSLRYLEYLERYPASPTSADLRNLAAALRTTPSALRGAGLEAPPGRHLTSPRGFTRLTLAECRKLIAPGGVGRIAFVASSGTVVLPVNFAVAAGTIVLRTTAGGIIEAHANENVSFEVDHLDEALEQGWSVLVRGQAHRVSSRSELRRLQEDATVWPWPGDGREVYVRIIPRRISGRRVIR